MSKSKNKPINSVKKFYFLEYFFVLLASIEKFSNEEQIFDSFKTLKEKHRLGESKYKKLTADKDLSKTQLDRYRYTLGQVIEEAMDYELVKSGRNRTLLLTEAGKDLLRIYRTAGQEAFNLVLFQLMERTYEAFRYILKFAYASNDFKPGLLVFPIYSPRQLGIAKRSISRTRDVQAYIEQLIKRVEEDIKKFLGKDTDLSKHAVLIIERLSESKLLEKEPNSHLPSKNFYKIVKRIRDYWLGVLLQEFYKYDFSISSFDFWMYRGKQIGIIQATEFYPNFNGRIVYPTAIIADKVNNQDFDNIYTYDNGESLFIHQPKAEKSVDKFVDALVAGYFDLRRSYRSYFINLSALREIVCYKLKISDRTFESLLDDVYKLNIQGKLRVKIALEVDRLPEETKAIYLKREPVLVDGKIRNIIGIDVSKGVRP